MRSLLSRRNINRLDLVTHLTAEAEQRGPLNYRVRSAACKASGGGWMHLGSVAAPREYFEDSVPLLFVDDLALTAGDFQVEEDWNEQRLSDALTLWRHVLGATSSSSFHDSVNVDRWDSHNSYFVHPAWACNQAEQYTETHASIPSGPFFDSASGIFATTIAELIQEWLVFRSEGQVRGNSDYAIIIPDKRGWLESVERSDENLSVDVYSDESSPVVCAFSGLTSRSTKIKLVSGVEDGRARFIVPADLNAIELYLLTPDGEVLDRFSENAWGRTWGDTLLRSTRVDPSTVALSDALRSGESDTVEFKSWISSKKRDTKAFELVASVIAFSNTSGGSVYIGVTNNGEPHGVNHDLIKTYASVTKGETELMKEFYVRDLRAMLAEGISPAPTLDFKWTSVANNPILRIDVKRSDDVHSAVENGQIYLRAGATNRKARGDDMLELVTRRRQSRSASQGNYLPRGTRLL